MKKLRRVRRKSVCIEFIRFLKMMKIYGSYRFYFLYNINKPLCHYGLYPFRKNKMIATRKDVNCNRSILYEMELELSNFGILDKKSIRQAFFKWIEFYGDGVFYNIGKTKLYNDLFWMHLEDKGFANACLID